MLVGRQLVHPAAELGGLHASKFGVFPEPPITAATSPLASGTSTVGLIGGPNGNGQWGVTSQHADSTMTPAKTKIVMNFLAWLFTPPHLGYWIKINQSGADIPTETAAPTVNLPGLKSLVPTGKVATVVDVVLDDVLSTAATNSGLRLVQAYMNGSHVLPGLRQPVAVPADQLGAGLGHHQPRRPQQVLSGLPDADRLAPASDGRESTPTVRPRPPAGAAGAHAQPAPGRRYRWIAPGGGGADRGDDLLPDHLRGLQLAEDRERHLHQRRVLPVHPVRLPELREGVGRRARSRC